MAIVLSTTVVRTEGMMAAPVDEDIVILNVPKNNYISLDAIGRRIWDLLETPQPVSALCNKLADEFEGDSEQIATDVMVFLQELHQEGLVRVVQ